MSAPGAVGTASLSRKPGFPVLRVFLNLCVVGLADLSALRSDDDGSGIGAEDEDAAGSRYE